MPKHRKPDMTKAGGAPEERPAQSDVELAIKAIVEKLKPKLLKPNSVKTKGRSGK